MNWNQELLKVVRMGGDGDIDKIKQCLANGADINFRDESGKTPLWFACNSNDLWNTGNPTHLETIKYLISKGADVNNIDNWRSTSLIWASVDGDLEVAKILVENGADMEIKGYSTGCGTPALIFALQYKRFEVANYLLSKGANPNAETDFRWTALMEASYSGYFDIAKLLIAKGAHLDTKSGTGWTALITASEEGHLNIVKLLVASGATIGIRNDNGNTALDLAKTAEIREFLSNANTKYPKNSFWEMFNF